MGAFFSQLGALLTAPPGNLIYPLVLAFSIAGAIQPAFLRWRSIQTMRNRREVLGLGVMLGTLIIFFLLGIAMSAGGEGARVVLPPLDRVVAFILIAWMIWIWSFPDPSQQPDRAILILTGVAVAAGLLNVVLRALQANLPDYNRTAGNILWQLATLGLLGLGAALLYIRRTEGYINGLAFLALAFLGHAIHLIVREPGDYSGIVRLGHMAAFPLLLTLSQRFMGQMAPSLPAESSTEGGPAALRRTGADPKAIHALLGLAAETNPLRKAQAIGRAVGQVMLADLTFVFRLTEDANRLDVTSGYDLIREDYLQGTQVENSLIPRLATAIQRGKPLRLSAAATSDDIKGLGTLIGLKDPGHLLSAPILSPENAVLGALVLLSPFSHREWSAEDQTLLVSIAGELAPMFRHVESTQAPPIETPDVSELVRARDDEILRLQRRNDDLATQLDALALETEKQVEPAEVAELRRAKEKADGQIRDLQAQLQSMSASSQPADAQLETQLNATLRDLARLQNQLAQSEQKVLELESAPSGERRKKEQAEVVASISQELRQPMSSIIGYTDLLLGESVGILGALQRKFIERIKASTERIGGLVNDLIQLTTLEVGLSDLKPEAMDLNVIIDNALAYTSSQVREKKISIHLDLPKSVAAVNADREAVQQILIHLLQNAGAATPMEGTVTLRVQTTVDEGRSYVLIQVADSGGGIPEEDLPRVFTRLFRADNVLIQGVGDTGVGLSIAKTLTEAQRGRIWVETQPGVGATFCVLLPAVETTVGRIPRPESR